MLSLLKDLAITAVIIFLNHWVYAVDPSTSYNDIIAFFSQQQTLFLTIGILGSAGLLIFSAMFEGLGVYKLTYGTSRVLVRVCQFFITFISVINIAYYFALDAHLLRDNGHITLVALVMLMAASCWSLRMIDFNHPTSEIIAPTGVVAFLSIVLVEFIWPLFF